MTNARVQSSNSRAETCRGRSRRTLRRYDEPHFRLNSDRNYRWAGNLGETNNQFIKDLEAEYILLKADLTDSKWDHY